ncbi:hypothetical protein [Fimbriimonas ginsengisoli]|uniref:Uncharacterized protein n=1 Tax=Fimbriimonas ginsengisoli Gsoil 348 TaxID=661478 RepID=A0A068NUP6_FIMGI|nr:hypothetical protein [Fimbriimonas ginsengisoli]AIE86490.1 hypothetical protein OP10G_3122 [Fimbriimonas ginsengisoli Gsoil 348]
MREWNTRLSVSFTVDGGSPTLISPIDSFSPSFALNAEPLHSIEATHIGVIYSPDSMTFSLTVKALGDVAGQLTALAMNGTPFDIILQESTGDDWSFHSILMSSCVITSAAPTNASISGAPSATFSGFALKSTSDGKAASSTASVP